MPTLIDPTFGTSIRPSDLQAILAHAIGHNRRVLVVGKPGIGKSDIIEASAAQAGADLVLFHPSVSDPTDYKGMPGLIPGEDIAHFYPFGDLAKLINAEKRTVAFFDDVGQSPHSVQAALMQLILARRVNGHAISPNVVFLAATNAGGHRAGVNALLEPVKSRFETIVHLEPELDDFIQWGIPNGIADELIAFLKFRPDLLSAFDPTSELRNSPCPRQWAAVSQWLVEGFDESRPLSAKIYAGCVGQGASTEFLAFLKSWARMPALDEIFANPHTTPVPTDIATKWAAATAIARRCQPADLANALIWLERCGNEYTFHTMSILKLDPDRYKTMAPTKAFLDWSVKNTHIFL